MVHIEEKLPHIVFAVPDDCLKLTEGADEVSGPHADQKWHDVTILYLLSEGPRFKINPRGVLVIRR